MRPIKACPLPEHSALRAYARTGAYVDCYATEIADVVSCARYIEAFYTTPLFKLERSILQLAMRLRSTDAEARALAEGSIDTFAAWHVESRTQDQLLMCDVRGNTRSWFMVEPLAGDAPARTRLHFGSAVTKAALDKPAFRWLLGFHVIYSKALLASARRRIGADND